MSALLRLAVILGGIALLFVLLAANKHVVQRYWLPAVEDAETVDGDASTEGDGDEGRGRVTEGNEDPKARERDAASAEGNGGTADDPGERIRE